MTGLHHAADTLIVALNYASVVVWLAVFCRVGLNWKILPGVQPGNPVAISAWWRATWVVLALSMLLSGANYINRLVLQENVWRINVALIVPILLLRNGAGILANIAFYAKWRQVPAMLPLLAIPAGFVVLGFLR